MSITNWKPSHLNGVNKCVIWNSKVRPWLTTLQIFENIIVWNFASIIFDPFAFNPQTRAWRNIFILSCSVRPITEFSYVIPKITEVYKILQNYTFVNINTTSTGSYDMFFLSHFLPFITILLQTNKSGIWCERSRDI